jgi:ABC-type metal ion transport system, periplasmic component/surface adhesin
MKKFISVLLGVCVLFVILNGCAQNNNSTESNDKISVISTIFAPYDFVKQIAGDNVNITMVLPPGSESHSYEPTPQDIIKIQNCDIFVYVGGESDAWVHEVLESMDTGKMKIITLMDCVDTVEEEVVEGMEHEEDHEDEHEHELDEHVWTSPKNAAIIVQKISDALCEADTASADSYKENTAAYLAKLNELDIKFQRIVDLAVRKTLIFGDRFPFRYFADTYGLEYYAAFPGCSTETEASAATIAFLIDKVKAEDIPVVFHVELSNRKMANTISEETGARILLFHACHNVTKDEMAKGITFLELMNQNALHLEEALK